MHTFFYTNLIHYIINEKSVHIVGYSFICISRCTVHKM